MSSEKLTEDKLRQIIREEIIREARSMKYSRAAEDAYDAIKDGDKEEFLLEVRSLLHAAVQVMLNGEQLVKDRRLQEAEELVDEAQTVLEEIE